MKKYKPTLLDDAVDYILGKKSDNVSAKDVLKSHRKYNMGDELTLRLARSKFSFLNEEYYNSRSGFIPATRNQLMVAKNSYQGDARKVLCVCTAGVLRSPTLANMLHTKLKYNTRAVGADRDFALIPLSEALICWADEIVFVSGEVLWKAEGLYSKSLNGKDIVVLDIPDEYSYDSELLKDICYTQYIESNVKKYEVKNES